jgi:amidase
VDTADLAFIGIARQAELIASGELAARDLLEVYLERIQRLDPKLNAFRIVFTERARMEADQADARRRAEGPAAERPLLGVPIAVKDDADVAGEVAMFGSAAEDRPARADSEIIRRLRAAGAVIIGITNGPELLLWPFTETAAHGITRNPWDLGRTPGGSSGGSGAAVAAGLVGAATGSDGAGSIRIPAACCGLFGIKPQRGRISIAPHSDADHAWHGMAVYGPLARRVEDAALFLDVTAQEGGGSFLAAARRPPGPLRVAISLRPPLPQPIDPQVLSATEGVATLLRSLGHTVERRDPPWLRAVPHVLVRYLRGARESGRALAHPDRYERRTKGVIRLGDRISDRVLADVRARERSLAAKMNALFSDFDVLLTPVLAEPAVQTGRWAGRSALWTLNGVTRFTMAPLLAAWNVTGQPAASVPAGFSTNGLPLAVQLVGRPGDEATLLSLAAQIEAERPWAQRRPELADLRSVA